MLHKVIVPQPIIPEGIKLLQKEGYEVKLLNDHSVENIKKEVSNADAILIRNATISREVIEAGEKLKVISRFGVGVDNIDLQAATEKGIYVTNTPLANVNSVTEHVIGLMLALAKDMRTIDLALREGRFEVRNNYNGVDLEGKTLGVIGLGNIGRRVAIKAIIGFEMKVIGYDPFITLDKVDPAIEVTSDWNRIFKESDFISINLPLNDNTRGIISQKEFSMMKNTAYLINCSRGPVINEEALIKALQKGLIAGAGIDVFEKEPPARNNPLLQMDNVIITPHIAGLTDAAMRRMAVQAAQGVIEVLNNKVPTWPVNKLEKRNLT